MLKIQCLPNLHSMTNGGPGLTKLVTKIRNALKGPAIISWDKLSVRRLKKCVKAKK